MKNKIKVMLGFTLASFLSAGLVSAQEADMTLMQAAPTETPNELTLTAVPPRLGDDYSLSVAPGESLQTTIEVRNPSDYPATIETFAQDFIIGEDGETPIPVEGEEVSDRWSLANWLTLTPNNVVLQPGGAASILVNIDVPADALPGGRYAMVLHKPVTGAEAGEATGAKVTAQVGTLLYLVVEGPMTESATVENFAFTGFSEFGPVDYSFAVRNDSSLHIRPELSIQVNNMFGSEVAMLEVDQKNIFPDSSREYMGAWDISWGFGRYTAVLEGMYGTNNNMALSAESAFWIIPVRAILAVLLIVVLIILIVITTRKRYQKMLDQEVEKVKKLDEKLKKANS